MLATFGFTLDVTAPIFLMVLLGWWTGKAGWLDQHFTDVASKIVFTIALPALLFSKISQADLSKVVDFTQLIYALSATFVGFGACWLIAKKMRLAPEDEGVFVQGAFRGNLGIVGIALCGSMYGDQGLAVGSILLAFMTMLYNILSVIVLSAPHAKAQSVSVKGQLLSIIKNPLILSILAALTISYLGWTLPSIAQKSIDYFSGMTLPLALLCIGASINSKVLRRSGAMSIKASWLKLLVLPFGFTVLAYFVGITGIYLGTLFLMLASPTAAASYVMAKQMHGNAELAASIIAITTAKSVVTVSLGIFVLRTLGVA